MIGGAAVATASGTPAPTPVEPPVVVSYVAIDPAPRGHSPRVRPGTGRDGGGLAPIPRITTPDLSAVPVDLPPIGTKLWEPPTGLADAQPSVGIVGDYVRGPGPGDGEPRSAAEVERVASVLTRLAPRYPEALRRAGVEGRVVVRFIVDTLGGVEPASVDVRDSAHDLFERSVREALAQARFRPATVGGRQVRQLVEMPFFFEMRGVRRP